MTKGEVAATALQFNPVGEFVVVRPQKEETTKGAKESRWKVSSASRLVTGEVVAVGPFYSGADTPRFVPGTVVAYTDSHLDNESVTIRGETYVVVDGRNIRCTVRTV